MTELATLDLAALSGPSRRVLLRRRALAHKGLMIGATLLTLIVVLALLAPFIAPEDPYAQDLARRLIPPVWYDKGGWAHLFGTDNLGRDYLSSIIYGARISLLIGEPMAALNPADTIGDQLTEVHRRHLDSTRAQARDRAIELLGQVGITAPAERLSQYPHQLSGGLRQRIMIAMALMCRPALLIADEPTTALDVTIQAQILRLLVDLQKSLGISMLLITHDLRVVARVAHRVLVMDGGEIVESGIAKPVFATPRHPYTRGLLASIPVPGRAAPGGRLGAISGIVPSLIGDMRGCAFRDRCAHATAVCAASIEVRSETGQDGASHDWRCILPVLPAEAA